MQDKKELRRHFSEVRKAAKTDAKDAVITEKVLALYEVAEADNVLMFASFGSEVDTWDLARKLIDINKALAYPKCGKDGVMTFHIVNDTADLKEGAYGIPEPDSSLSCPDITARTVCIVPGLAFTEKGARLGYGGGFYDRFIAAYPEITTIALAYEAMITDSLPVQEHDMTVKLIVTEERTVLCNE
ncbi:MAG: 5-formyltetrahydrofolate cyclo-ligase [Ruminococcus sp.]|nr:5-formyltetrahydrofolate cyclo-ligase [Ruminococcus sp.]